VLVVDDIATTGGTLAGAATALRQAGARQVEVAVLGASSGAFGPAPEPTDPATGLARRNRLDGLLDGPRVAKVSSSC
jgi:adenine/guanine phosphoribosyltransferase-like PRPP-binding protein